jgi:hypothetical protein
VDKLYELIFNFFPWIAWLEMWRSSRYRPTVMQVKGLSPGVREQQINEGWADEVDVVSVESAPTRRSPAAK